MQTMNFFYTIFYFVTVMSAAIEHVEREVPAVLPMKRSWTSWIDPGYKVRLKEEYERDLDYSGLIIYHIYDNTNSKITGKEVNRFKMYVEAYPTVRLVTHSLQGYVDAYGKVPPEPVPYTSFYYNRTLVETVLDASDEDWQRIINKFGISKNKYHIGIPIVS